MNLKHLLYKNAPGLLVGTGVVTMIGAVVLAARQSPTAAEAVSDIPPSDTKARVRALIPIYGPVVALTAVGTGFIFLSHTTHARRYAAVSAAWGLAEANRTRLIEVMREQLGEKKAKPIETAVMEPRQAPPPDLAELGDVDGPIFYDAYMGRYFRAKNVEAVRAQCTDANELLFGEGYVTLNEFWHGLGLPKSEYGEDIGWTLSNDVQQITLMFDSFLVNDRPVISVIFVNLPGPLA